MVSRPATGSVDRLSFEFDLGLGMPPTRTRGLVAGDKRAGAAPAAGLMGLLVLLVGAVATLVVAQLLHPPVPGAHCADRYPARPRWVSDCSTRR